MSCPVWKSDLRSGVVSYRFLSTQNCSPNKKVMIWFSLRVKLWPLFHLCRMTSVQSFHFHLLKEESFTPGHTCRICDVKRLKTCLEGLFIFLILFPSHYVLCFLPKTVPFEDFLTVFWIRGESAVCSGVSAHRSVITLQSIRPSAASVSCISQLGGDKQQQRTMV